MIIKTGVFCAVALGVGYGVLYGIGVKLNADNLPCGFGGDKSDCSYSAICVKHNGAFVKPCELHCLAVELFGLNGVDLVKRFRRNPKNASAKGVFNISAAEKHFFTLSEH